MNKRNLTALISLAVAVTMFLPYSVFASNINMEVSNVYSTSHRITGAADPKMMVIARIGGSSYMTKVKKDGKFSLRIPYQRGGEQLVVQSYSNGQPVQEKTIEVLAANVFYKEGFSYHRITPLIRSRITGKSYQENPDINLNELRYVKIKYVDFESCEHKGELIVNRSIASDIIHIFYQLYAKGYPLAEVALIDNYGASDDRSMEANNTTSFNYRKITSASTLSRHAYGMAIDINPLINPYVKGSAVLPASGKIYAQRDVRKNRGKYAFAMIQEGDFIYNLFQEYGFHWGGDWNSLKDYQHFEK